MWTDAAHLAGRRDPAMRHLGRQPIVALAVASMALAQSVSAELSVLVAKAKLDGPVAAWCRGAFRPAHPGAFAVAVTSAAERGRYLVLELDGSVKELGSFARRPDLSCYSRAEAAQLDVSIRRSATIHGQIAPRWEAAVICGFVDDTTAACWQYSPDDDAFVKVGGWIT